METRKTSDRFDVVISGASFAGLALARALASALGPDLNIAVIDRTPAGRSIAGAGDNSDPRAFAISAASKRLLDAIGVWPELKDKAQTVAEIEITDSELNAGIRPVLLTYRNDVAPGEPASYIVPAEALRLALVQACAADTGITLIAPATAESFSANEHGVTVQLAGGREIETALLVAADGRRSSLRDVAGIKLVRWETEQTAIVTTVAHERPHGGRAVQHFLPAGPFAILPLPGNRACITWTESAAEARRILALDDEGFLAETDKRFGGRLGAVQVVGARASWSLEMHLARSMAAQRFALIGDTVRGVHPIAGQGLNLGFRDVAALTDVISDCARVGLDLGNADALARYERWRRFDSMVSAAAFDGLNRLFSNDNALVRAVRDFGLGIVDRLPGVKQMLVTEAAGLSGELPRLLQGGRT